MSTMNAEVADIARNAKPDMETSAKRFGQAPPPKFHSYIGIAIALLCWLMIVAAGLVFREPFVDVENSLIDVRMHLPHKVKPSDQIIFVDIDDRTIALLGSWPWPRSHMAEVVNILNRTDPSGIFIDVIFSEETNTDEDLKLAHALEDCGKVLLCAGFDLVDTNKHHSKGQPNSILESFAYDLRVEEGEPILKSTRALAPIPLFMASAIGIGHISFVPDEDGVARHMPLMIDLNGRYFPSIDIEIARTILDVRHEDVEIIPGRFIRLKGAKPPDRVEEIEIVIPVDPQMRIMINYAGPWGESFMHYPLNAILGDLLSDKRSQRERATSFLEDKFIILSAAFSGAADMGPTSLEPLVPLSEIHGHIVSSIVNQQFLSRVPIAIDMAIALILCVILGSLSKRLRTLHYSALCGFLIALWILCSFALFSFFGIVVDIVWPCAAILLSYGGCAGHLHLMTERERASLRRAFSNYVSPNILSRILEDPSKLKLGGERVNLSILVLVLEDFEKFSENAEPEETINLLTSVYEKACEPILEQGGTIDKFTKDGLIAFFGAPIQDENHPRSAAKAALCIRYEIGKLSASMIRSGQRMVGIKMAINSGFATVGNIGSSKRMDYTVIGKNVDQCIRMANAALEDQIFIPQKVFLELEDFIDAEECGEVRLAGHSKPFFAYNIASLKETPEPVQIQVPGPRDKMKGKKFLGPYRLDEKVGVGSAGTVYKGYDESLDRGVAIKVLFSSLKGKRLSSITEEARMLAKLSHPNIVQIHYTGAEDGIGFLVMEFVDGINLRELINTEGPLSISDSLDFIIQTSRGLHAAHKQGIIHRDIKPANLLANSYDVIKITDFGLAGLIASQSEQSGHVAGTFQYASPEQARGAKVDCRSDIYSLGITLFHLLTGELPFKADSIAGLTWHHAESELPIRPLNEKGIPDCLIKVIQKMTAKAPRDRYSDYLELLKNLDMIESEIST